MMSPQHHQFQIGQIQCTVLLDDATVIGRERMQGRFPTIPETDLEAAYAALGRSLDEADNCFNILHMQAGDATVLIDTGQGGQPNGGLLPESLRAAGLSPADVTLVVLTHTHGDHVMGLLTPDGDPAFPNASYVISAPELDFWKGRLDDAQRPLLAMMEARGLRVIAPDEAILPWLTASPIPGHTPGQIALEAVSEGASLLHLADLLHTPVQFAHPDWSPRFDTDTSVSVPTRRQTLGRVADENRRVMFYHLAFPGVGTVRREGDAFAWEPLQP